MHVYLPVIPKNNQIWSFEPKPKTSKYCPFNLPYVHLNTLILGSTIISKPSNLYYFSTINNLNLNLCGDWLLSVLSVHELLIIPVEMSSILGYFTWELGSWLGAFNSSVLKWSKNQFSLKKVHIFADFLKFSC